MQLCARTLHPQLAYLSLFDQALDEAQVRCAACHNATHALLTAAADAAPVASHRLLSIPPLAGNITTPSLPCPQRAL